MSTRTDDIRVTAIRELTPPAHLLREFPLADTAADTVAAARRAIHRILHGQDDRMLVIIGPCSIHDPEAAREYAQRLMHERKRLALDLEIVMRVYFEKPRTTVGWKGLINDPHLDGSFDVNRGLRLARELLVDVNALGMPAGTEFLDPISPQYYSDLIAWGAIGARTTESQVHRELASGMSCPLGFKNGTDGNLKIAADAIKAAQHPHCFLGVTKGGISAIVQTAGNEDCHVILRGGKTPNYDAASVDSASQALAQAGLAQKLMIDCSHGNSSKQHENQLKVAAAIAEQLTAGDMRIMGAMVESHLVAGRQDLHAGQCLKDLTYGQSITDACLGWDASVQALEALARGVRERRLALASAK
ncbi:MAG TPA: 3-deoxy-7-phosphoheptulonate synthase [Burkholderiaceae bacterium]|nr:3-deoxy-7-phosphoheptulonate synthase [Burkholderiaceae bacterium]